MLDLALTHLYRAAQPPAGAQPWLLVLMHGVGSNERDLFGLASQVPPAFHVLSLRAPHTLAPGAYAWFQFGVLPDGRRVIDEAQETASRDVVAQVLQAASAQLDVPAQRVVVGGFSQGGIMSLSLLLTQPQRMHAAMVWHSRLLPQVLPLVAAPQAFEGRQLWVSHGTEDTMIPLASAHDIRDRMSALPLRLRYAEFPGGHEIRPAELRAAMDWLAGLAA